MSEYESVYECMLLCALCSALATRLRLIGRGAGGEEYEVGDEPGGQPPGEGGLHGEGLARAGGADARHVVALRDEQLQQRRAAHRVQGGHLDVWRQKRRQVLVPLYIVQGLDVVWPGPGRVRRVYKVSVSTANIFTGFSTSIP